MNSSSAPQLANEAVGELHPDRSASTTNAEDPANLRGAEKESTGGGSSDPTSDSGRSASLPLLKLPLVADEPVSFWLRRGDQLFAGTVTIFCLGLMFVHWIRLSRWGAEPIEIERVPERWAEYRIDMNRATRYEWQELDGIGPALAERIVENRERLGPFRNIEDLGRVRGIGPKTLEKLAPHLEISPE